MKVCLAEMFATLLLVDAEELLYQQQLLCNLLLHIPFQSSKRNATQYDQGQFAPICRCNLLSM